MGLFDKIKKAVNDSGLVDAAKNTIKNFTESTQDTEHTTTSTQETSVQEEREVEFIECNCEIGDFGKCSYFANEFCFTCPKTQPCSKKKEHLSELKEAENPRFIDYADTIGYYESRLAEQDSDYMRSFYSKQLVAMYREFAEEFYPNLVNAPELIRRVFGLGISEDSALFRQFLYNANKLLNKDQVNEKKLLLLFSAIQLEPYGFNCIARAFFLADPTVFELDNEDFIYLLKQSLIFLQDESRSSVNEVFEDPSQINLMLFYETDTKLKRIGYGGEAAGEYGDTLWNAINKQMTENVKDREKLQELIEESETFVSKVLAFYADSYGE